MVLCPYCADSVADTDDHVFPQFLGGLRTIPACGPCNSTFGHTFEGAVAKMLEPAYVQLAKLGVPLPERERWWKRAHEVDGVKVDLGVGPEGIKARSSHPIIETDENGEITGAYFESEHELEEFKRTMAVGRAHV